MAAARKPPGKKSSAHGSGGKLKGVNQRPVTATHPLKPPAPSLDPSIPSANHVIVGIGASAGGLEAMEDFMDDRIRAVELIAS